MEKEYEEKYHRLEERNWWFTARRHMVTRLIKKNGIPPDAKILEIGCAGGPLIRLLTEAGYTNIYGIDVSEDAIAMCVRREIHNVQVMDGGKTDFSDGEFDLIIASDVLEHIEHDDQALADWYRILKPSGKIILFVPAFGFLWSGHDVANRHFRRYTKSMLLGRLKEARFRINRFSYWNFLLFFPTFTMRGISRLLNKHPEPKDQMYDVPPIVNGSLTALLKAENTFLGYADFPVGVSLFAEVTKE